MDSTAREVNITRARDMIENGASNLEQAARGAMHDARRLDEDLRRVKAACGALGGALQKAVDQACAVLTIASADAREMCDALQVGNMLNELQALARRLVELSQ